MSNVISDNNSVRLTTTQKLWLAYSFVPVISFVVILIFVMTALPYIIGQPIPPLLPIFLVIVLLVMAFQASKGLRDSIGRSAG